MEALAEMKELWVKAMPEELSLGACCCCLPLFCRLLAAYLMKLGLMTWRWVCWGFLPLTGTGSA